MELNWVCQLKLFDQSSNETPKGGWARLSYGAFKNVWGLPNGSSAQRTGRQKETEYHYEKVKKNREIGPLKRKKDGVFFFFFI